MYIPASISIPIGMNQREQAEMVAHQSQSAPSSVVSAANEPHSTAASNTHPLSDPLTNQLVVLLNSIFGPGNNILSALGFTKSEDGMSTVMSAERATQTEEVLAQLMTTLKPFVEKFFDDLQERLDKFDYKNIASALMEPLNDLKKYVLGLFPK
ncbi:hypothetical protein EV175_004315 [Coemansia sp. RSA 1933]|nr:hypothetical protein EV175_004315 [Coemansia sp. RSA 1933]